MTEDATFDLMSAYQELYLGQQGNTTAPVPSPLDQLDDNEVVAVA